MKTLDIANLIKDNTPEGMEVDKDKSTDSKIVFKDIVKSTRWKELGSIKGYYTDSTSSVEKYHHNSVAHYDNANTYRTYPQAQASIAQAKLTQIAASVNKGIDIDSEFYSIVLDYNGELEVCRREYDMHKSFLSFESREVAYQVLEDNKELFEQLKPLAI